MDGATRENGTTKRRFISSSSTDSDTKSPGSSNSSHVNYKSVRRKKVQRLSYTPPHEKDGRRTLSNSCREMSSCSNLAAMISNSSDEKEETSKLLKHIPIWRQKNFKNSPVIVKSDPYAFNFTPPVSTKNRVKPVHRPIQKLSSSKSTSRITIGGKSLPEVVATTKESGMVNNSHRKKPDLKVIRKNVTSPHPAFDSYMSSSALPMTKDLNSNTFMKSSREMFTDSCTLRNDDIELPHQRARSSPRMQMKKSLSATNLCPSTTLTSTPTAERNNVSESPALNRSVSASNLLEFNSGTPTYEKNVNKYATPCTSRKKNISPHPGVRTSPRNQIHSTNRLVRSSSYSLLPVVLPSKDDFPECLSNTSELCTTPMKGANASSYSPPLVARTSSRKKLKKSFSTTNFDFSSNLLSSELAPAINEGLCSPLSNEIPEEIPQFAFGRSPILRALIEKAKLNDNNVLPIIDTTVVEDNNFITPEQSFISQHLEDVVSDVNIDTNVLIKKDFLDANNPKKELVSILGTIAIPKIESHNSTDSEYASCCSSQETSVINGKVDDVYEEDGIKYAEHYNTTTRGILRKSSSLIEASKNDLLDRNKVGFRKLQVYYFDRQQGFDTVPHAGDVSIGMVGSHFTTRIFSLDTGKRPLLTLVDSDEVSDSEISDECRFDQREGEYSSNLFLERIDSKHRTKILKSCGVSVKKNYHEMTLIRESRSRCGCSCRGLCVPSRCECALSGIQCQVDGPANDGSTNTHPCWCTADSCGNPEGRSEFERNKVHEHFFTTMRRFADMEKTGIFCSPTVTRFDQESDDEDVDITSINLNKEYFLKTNNVNCPKVEISNTAPLPDSIPHILCNKELLRVASCL